MLLIRLHALGDVAVTLPAARALRERYPEAQIDFLTLQENAPLLRAIGLFDRVLDFPPTSSPVGRLARAVRTGARVRARKYDVIVDLQRNRVSRIIRRSALPAAWGEFDRFSPRPASERVLETFLKIGFHRLSPRFSSSLPAPLQEESLNLLDSHGHDRRKKLVVLNPAGLWETRNWPLEDYVSLANLWRQQEPVQFVLLGTEKIREKSSYLRARLGSGVIDLVGQTRIEIAFALLHRASAVITEDSGLMHMAWCQGIPIVALFGSSRHVWSAPTGLRARTLDSGDLPCGQCMEPVCTFGDVHCLTRHTPQRVLEIAKELTTCTAAVLK
jgi:ADP-heptose:LPS heptosyltransferase